MKYIPNGSYDAESGKPRKWREDDEPEQVVERVSDMLRFTLVAFEGLHSYMVSKGHELTPSQVGAFNELTKIVDGAHDEPVIVLEGQHFDVLKLVCDWTLPPSPAWREVNKIKQILDEALTKAPDDPAALNGAGDLGDLGEPVELVKAES